MPMYDYRCYECGWTGELFTQRFDTPQYCPECEYALESIFPLCSIVFKGLGFYTTENRKVTEYQEGTGLPKIW